MWRRAILVSLPMLIGFAAVPALAQLPRGAMLSAEEQSADETTGTTIARGAAEISFEGRPIRGSADVIEVRPKLNEVLFKGRASVSVGKRRYDSDTVSCSLDFMRCAAVTSDQDLPVLPAGIAATTPR